MTAAEQMQERAGLDGRAMKNDGGPAFPIYQPDMNVGNDAGPGMSLRDWFAGQAMVGLMSDPGLRPSNLDEFEHMATRLYQVADAMLKARDTE